MKLGLGCGALGDARLDERQAAALVDAALRVGVKVFDTARSYGESEGRLGRFLHQRAVTISTKGGYGVEPVREWTGAAITAGIERARHELGVDRLGLFHLHSCPLEVLQRPDLLEAPGVGEAAGAGGANRVRG
jgi:aryl-alcohol dehydrogenase-like predicted oxidoreductase